MINEKKRLIISDLDGTLLNDKAELSQKTIDVVKELTRNGHIFCISTGRPYRAAIKYYNQLGLNTLMSNINGGYISNPSDTKFHSINNVFSKDILFDLLEDEEVRKKMKFLYAETQNGGAIFTHNREEKISQDIIDLFHIQREDIDIIEIEDVEKWKSVDVDIYSILINIDVKDLDDVSFAIKSITTTLFVDYWPSEDSSTLMLDISSVFQNKGKAMEFISCYYGIPLRNTYAFGDGRNDIAMMKLTTRSYAMRNALYATKMSSYKMTKFSNDDDGVAYELEEYVLKK